MGCLYRGFSRAATLIALVGLLLGASSAAAQSSGAIPAPPFDTPPLMSDGVGDTTVIQPPTGDSRFSIGQHGPSTLHLPAVRENVELVSKLGMNTPVEFRFDPETGLPDPTEPPVVPGQIADLAVYGHQGPKDKTKIIQHFEIGIAV